MRSTAGTVRGAWARIGAVYTHLLLQKGWSMYSDHMKAMSVDVRGTGSAQQDKRWAVGCGGGR